MANEMVNEKYYWMVYSSNNVPLTYRIYNEIVTKEHPFSVMKKFTKSVFMNMVLENWKEITKKEYQLFVD